MPRTEDVSTARHPERPILLPLRLIVKRVITRTPLDQQNTFP